MRARRRSASSRFSRFTRPGTLNTRTMRPIPYYLVRSTIWEQSWRSCTRVSSSGWTLMTIVRSIVWSFPLQWSLLEALAQARTMSSLPLSLDESALVAATKASIALWTPSKAASLSKQIKSTWTIKRRILCYSAIQTPAFTSTWLTRLNGYSTTRRTWEWI